MSPRKNNPKKVYFIGIKGVAMAGLAVMAKELGYAVAGSDVKETFITDELLKKHQIHFYEGFDADNLKTEQPDIVVVGAAYGANNPEVKALKARRLKVVTQSEMLGEIMTAYETVGVAGVHGKTTTSSMLALILEQAGFSPSYMIGTSSIPGLPDSAHIGSGQYFVVEADEYKKSEADIAPKFLDYPIRHLIVTSIELDHPDIYPSAEHVYQVFYQLCLKIPRGGTVVANTDWPLVRRLVSRLADRHCLSYGFEPSAKFQIVDVSDGEKTIFSIKWPKLIIGPIELAMPGRHNILNATAAVLMARELGVNQVSIEKTLRSFVGPKRRFEYLGTINGALYYDDYAHHPTALEFLIEAAKKRFPTKKIIVVFQPHTYSRTGRLLEEFGRSLKDADRVVILNIWASAREKSGYVTVGDLLTEIRKHRRDVEYRASLEEVTTYLAGSVGKGDVVLLVGAGDVYKIYDKLAARPN
ncbi:MAG: UDP-N-acetylmuramate--L-alanine ligase [Patescibacteria group bacterium]